MNAREKQLPLKNDPVPLPRALLKSFSVDHTGTDPKPDLMFAAPLLAPPIRGGHLPSGRRATSCLYTSAELMSTLTCLKDPPNAQRDSAVATCHPTLETYGAKALGSAVVQPPASAACTASPRSVRVQALASPLILP
jgi:hypothetical protein